MRRNGTERWTEPLGRNIITLSFEKTALGNYEEQFRKMSWLESITVAQGADVGTPCVAINIGQEEGKDLG